MSALASVDQDEYQLVEAPPLEDHVCWASGHKPAIKMASALMYQKVREEPTRSISKIYEEVRTQFAEGMDSSTKLSFFKTSRQTSLTQSYQNSLHSSDPSWVLPTRS